MRGAGCCRSWSRHDAIWAHAHASAPSSSTAATWMEKIYGRCIKRRVRFVVVSKAKMTVTQDAQGLAKRERVHVRERVVHHGQGKTATEERLRTELVGLEGLTTYDSYGAPEQTQYAHRRDYEGQPINAVVVRSFDNRIPAREGTVYLTN